MRKPASSRSQPFEGRNDVAAPLEQRGGMGLAQHETIGLCDLGLQFQTFNRSQRIGGVFLQQFLQPSCICSAALAAGNAPERIVAETVEGGPDRPGIRSAPATSREGCPRAPTAPACKSETVSLRGRSAPIECTNLRAVVAQHLLRSSLNSSHAGDWLHTRTQSDCIIAPGFEQLARWARSSDDLPVAAFVRADAADSPLRF